MRYYLKYYCILVAFLLCIYNIWTQPIALNNLTLEVARWAKFDFLETRYLYLLAHAFSIVPVLALSFDKRVHFYTEWRYLWRGLLATALFFIVWDYFKTDLQVWGFNPKYYLGITVLGLPLEELGFFITFPFCSVFIYECLNHYVKKDIFAPIANALSWIFITSCFILTCFYWERAYTSTTCMVVGFAFLAHQLAIDAPYRGRMFLAMLVILFPHFLMDSVFTGAFTDEPLVIYNPDEYMGVFAGTIPVEDFIYGALLHLMNISFLEYYRNNPSIER
jgi:lycopene cyclase domain-containing protein